MKTITNISSVADYSGEPPVVTYSNPVTTVIRTPAPPPIITRIFYNLDFGCCCNCNSCCNNCWNNCWNNCCNNCNCGWFN